jgi:hypothetical protein
MHGHTKINFKILDTSKSNLQFYGHYKKDADHELSGVVTRAVCISINTHTHTHTHTHTKNTKVLKENMIACLVLTANLLHFRVTHTPLTYGQENFSVYLFNGWNMSFVCQ